MNGHSRPIPFIPVREWEQPFSYAPHLTPFPQQTSVIRLGLMFPYSHVLELYSRSGVLPSPQKHQHHSNLHTFLSPYVVSQLFCPSRAFALKHGDAVKWCRFALVPNTLAHSTSASEAQRHCQICSIIRSRIKGGGGAKMRPSLTSLPSFGEKEEKIFHKRVQ